jgi:outer membrane protein TolC
MRRARTSARFPCHAVHRFLVALVVLLSGCESYAPAPLDRQAKLAEHLSDLEFAPGRGPLSIEAVSLLAVKNNPDLKAARARRGVAAAQVLEAGILPNPALNASYAFLLGGPGTVGALTASLGQNIKALVTLRARRRSAIAAAQEIDASLLWQEWQTIGKARLLVVDIVEGERQRRLLAAAQRVIEARLGLERQALAQANTTLTTLVPALTAAADIRRQLDNLDRLQQTRRRDLDALLGLAPDVRLPLDERLNLPPIDPAAVVALLPDLAQRRPDLIALQLGYRSEEEKVRAAILGQFPALVFGGTGGRDTSDVQSAGPQITMDLPIFDRNQGTIAIERATRQQLHDEFTARLAAANGEVRGMLAEAALIARQIDTVRKEAADLRQAAARAEGAYRAGNLDERGYVDIVVAALAKEEELVVLDQLRQERLVALATLIGAGMAPTALPPDTGQ